MFVAVRKHHVRRGSSAEWARRVESDFVPLCERWKAFGPTTWWTGAAAGTRSEAIEWLWRFHRLRRRHEAKRFKGRQCFT
jgi:hypothetical protein